MKLIKIYLYCIFSCSLLLKAQINKKDSLVNELNKIQNKSNDEKKCQLYFALASEWATENIDSALYYYNKVQFFCKDNLNDRRIRLLISIGDLYNTKYNYKGAIESYQKALFIIDEMQMQHNTNDLSKLKSNCYRGLGGVYLDQGNYSQALDFFFKAQKIDEQIKYKGGEAENLSNIGIVYTRQAYYPKAMKYFFMTLKLNKEIKNKSREASSLVNIGIVYKEQGHYDKSLEYYFKALHIYDSINAKQGEAVVLGNIGNVYYNQNNFEKALEYFFKALKINTEIDNQKDLALNYANIASLYFDQQNNKEAEKYLKKAIEIGEKINMIHFLSGFYMLLSNLYEGSANYKYALMAHKKFVLYNDSIMKKENQIALAQKEVQYEFDKQQEQQKIEQEKKDTIAKEEKRRQKIITYGIAFFAILILALAIVIFISWNNSKKQNQIIASQKKLVEEKNKDIIDSIIYAKRIQQAILPNDKQWYKTLPNSFVLYQPKDIVAGDFYWLEETEQYIYIAAADCTGHGVPGAMVSVVCSNALTKAVLEEKQTETNTILDTTRAIVLERLGKSEENIQDGMDVCLVRINKNNRKDIQYSGANRPLFVVTTQNELQEIKPDKQPIGKYDYEKPFTAHNLTLNQNDVLYLITDGYADQFGGEHNKKFSAKSLRALLLSLAAQNMEVQKDNLLQTFLTYRNTTTQTDDVTVIGVRI